MHFCAISSCENSLEASENVSFHSFPLQNPNLLKRWVSSMKFSEIKPPLSFYLCSKHFTQPCFDSKGNIRPDAIPSLEAADDNVEPNSLQNVLHQKKCSVEEYLGAFLCRMCSCKLTADDENNMISIFDDNKRVFEKLKSCLPIMIEDCDDLPHHVCDKCFKQLERMYAIRSLSATTEMLLFHYLSSEADKSKHDKNRSNIETRTAEIDTHRDRYWVEEQLPLKGPITCNLCDAEFVNMDKFDTHMEEHGVGFTQDPPTEELSTVCSSCGLIFESEAVYQEHKRIQKYECVTCDIILKSYCEMKSHECVPYNHGDFCEVIDTTDVREVFVNELADDRDYNPQEFTKPPQKRRKYYCSPCNRQFQRQVNWQKHKARHEKDEAMLYDCKDCDQQFDRLRLLNQHRERVHRSHHNWICGYCGKHTTTKLSLNIHERIHTGVKPFICEWCGNAFRSKANLSQHHAKHTGIRRHSCTICNKMFSRKSFVTTHMRVHTGERPYACDICEQRFTQVGDMRRHRRRHVTQHQQQSDVDGHAGQMYIIQQVVFKDEKDNTHDNEADTDSVVMDTNNASNSALHLNSKITLSDIRAHFL